MEIMPITERINVRGAINSLEVGSTPLQLPKDDYKLSSVRATAGSVTGDTGKTFSVSVIEEFITVTRKWCPKYRKKVLTGEIETRLKELFLEKAESLGIQIKEMEVMPDHVHLFVKSKPTYAPHFIVQQLKGYSSRILRQEFASLKSRLPSLWTRSYYCESVGNISEATILKYIENQKNV